MCRAYSLATFMCWLSKNQGALASWSTKGLSMSVQGWLYHTSIYSKVLCRAGLCPWDNWGKVNKNLPHTWTMRHQQCYEGKAEMWSVRAMHTFSCPEISGTMLQCYVLTYGRLVTTFLAPPWSQCPGQGPPLTPPTGQHWSYETLIKEYLLLIISQHSGGCFERIAVLHTTNW
jgi:hypothetical protein